MKKIFFLFLVLYTSKIRAMDKRFDDFRLCYGGSRIIGRYMAAVLNTEKTGDERDLAKNADREREKIEREVAREVEEQMAFYLTLKEQGTEKEQGAEKPTTNVYFTATPKLKKQLQVKQENIHTLLSLVCSNNFSSCLLKAQQLIEATDLNYVHTLNKNRENEKPVTILDIVDIRLETEKNSREQQALTLFRQQLTHLGAKKIEELELQD